MNDQEHMNTLAESLQTRPATRDEYGEFVINGKRGNIHRDGQGYSLYLTIKNALMLKKAILELKRFAGTQPNWETPKRSFASF